MTTDDEVGIHLFMSAREVRTWRAKGIFPEPGAPLDEFRERYIRQMREAAAGRVASAEKSDLDTERARLAREQADQMALKNAVMRAELVPVAEITQAVVGMIEVVKTKLKRVAAKVAPGDGKLKARIANAIEDALIDLSSERALERPDQQDDDKADDE